MSEMESTFFEGKANASGGATLVMENRSLIDRELYMEAARALSRRWTRYAAMAFGLLLGYRGHRPEREFSDHRRRHYHRAQHLFLAGDRDAGFRQTQEKHGAESWLKTVRFYSDRIETETGAGSISTFSYDAIRQLRETENLVIIVFGKKQPSTMLRKDSFTLGTFDLAMAFLSEMRI